MRLALSLLSQVAWLPVAVRVMMVIVRRKGQMQLLMLMMGAIPLGQWLLMVVPEGQLSSGGLGGLGGLALGLLIRAMVRMWRRKMHRRT
jgi:hypothetical protein